VRLAVRGGPGRPAKARSWKIQAQATLLNSHELSSAEWRSRPVVRALRRVERLLFWPLKPPLTRSGYVRMNPDGRLRDYPYIVVRFACRECPRIGRYRLAVLAERFGADADLATVLEAISASCPRRLERHPEWCFTKDGSDVGWTQVALAACPSRLRSRPNHRPSAAPSPDDKRAEPPGLDQPRTR
jgi:hypothetical protein